MWRADVGVPVVLGILAQLVGEKDLAAIVQAHVAVVALGACRARWLERGLHLSCHGSVDFADLVQVLRWRLADNVHGVADDQLQSTASYVSATQVTLRAGHTYTLHAVTHGSVAHAGRAVSVPKPWERPHHSLRSPPRRRAACARVRTNDPVTARAVSCLKTTPDAP